MIAIIFDWMKNFTVKNVLDTRNRIEDQTRVAKYVTRFRTVSSLLQVILISQMVSTYAFNIPVVKDFFS
jgi:hypothetical protein